jgi:AcrR family transcriptional regulator
VNQVDPITPHKPVRPVAAPGVVPGDAPDDVRDEILTAAAGLFSTYGFTATSTDAIATSAGVGRDSLLHHFARKQDILLELLGRTVRPTLKAVRQNRLEQYEPDVALWQLVYMDVANLCRGPNNLGALQLLPEVRGEEFAWYWRRRHELFRVYTDHIARGFVSGAFTLGQPRVAGEVVFGLVESVIIARPQFRRRIGTPAAIADASLGVCGVPTERIRTISGAPTSLEPW